MKIELTQKEVEAVQKQAKRYDCPNCFKLGVAFVINLLREKK